MVNIDWCRLSTSALDIIRATCLLRKHLLVVHFIIIPCDDYFYSTLSLLCKGDSLIKMEVTIPDVPQYHVVVSLGPCKYISVVVLYYSCAADDCLFIEKYCFMILIHEMFLNFKVH